MSRRAKRAVRVEASSADFGAPRSFLEATTFLIVGSAGLAIAGVQPVLLGALVQERRLSAAALGWTTTVEFITLGLGVSLAGMFLRPDKLRLKCALAALSAVVIDLLICNQSNFSVIGDRAAAGLAEGVLVWSTMLMIARSATPARWSAIFLVTQAIVQLAFAAIAPALLIKPFGADGGFYGMAGIALIALFASGGLPTRMTELPKAADGEGRQGGAARALASLAGVFLIFAYFIGLFAYLGQLATQAHLSDEQGGLAVAIAVGASVLGSGFAAVVAKRASYFWVFVLSAPVNAAAMFLFARHQGVGPFLVATVLFGLFWGFFMPLQLPFVIAEDPTRRAALLVPGVQAVGAAAGPLLCSFFVTDADARGALGVCAACFAMSLVVATALRLRRPAQVS